MNVASVGGHLNGYSKVVKERFENATKSSLALMDLVDEYEVCLHSVIQISANSRIVSRFAEQRAGSRFQAGRILCQQGICRCVD